MRWFERKFSFDLPVEAFPEVVERLRGAPARLEDKLRGLPHDVLTRRDGQSWSIQEHAGHLLDLEDVHIARLDDYLAGQQVLTAADPRNQRTWDANYNRRSIDEILAGFRRERERFVERLDSWDPKLISRSAFHPRLYQGMRVIDLAEFIGDHDDHHLAAMTALGRKFRAASV